MPRPEDGVLPSGPSRREETEPSARPRWEGRPRLDEGQRRMIMIRGYLAGLTEPCASARRQYRQYVIFRVYGPADVDATVARAVANGARVLFRSKTNSGAIALPGSLIRPVMCGPWHPASKTLGGRANSAVGQDPGGRAVSPAARIRVDCRLATPVEHCLTPIGCALRAPRRAGASQLNAIVSQLKS
jgi:hypothetical protein